MVARGSQNRRLRRAAVPNVWRQWRAQRVHCTPGLGSGVSRGFEADDGGLAADVLGEAVPRKS